MAKITINGPIVSSSEKWIYDWFDIPATSPKDVSKVLDGLTDGESVEIEIASGGGSAFAGAEIYTLLKAHKAPITVKIMSVAASAASVIAMAGDKIYISPVAQIMIHNAAMQSAGDYRQHAHDADFLANYNDTISNAYMLKTGLDKTTLLAMMDNETWFTAKQAIENHFADEILFDDEKRVAASFDSGLLPREVIDKMTIELAAKNQPKAKEPEADFIMLKNKINLERWRF